MGWAWRVQYSHASRGSSPLHTILTPRAGRILVQEGSTELGSGHEDTVGQRKSLRNVSKAGTGEGLSSRVS